jgi:hypothetical protein
VLTNEAYQLVHIARKGQPDRETLTFPAYLDSWKAKIDKAYDVTPSP